MKTHAFVLAALLLMPCAHAQTATNGIQAQRHVAHESDLAANVVHLAPNQLGLADDAPTHIYRGTSAGNVLAIGSAGLVGPQGSKGDTGQTGAMGSQGAAGAKGDTGTAGAQGIAGVNGQNGQPGATGPSGPNFPWSFTGATLTTGPTSINVTGAGATLSALNNALTLNVPGYLLPIGSATVLGGYKVGGGLSVDTGGVLSRSALTNGDLPSPMTLTASGPGVVPLTITTAPGQTADALDINSSTGTGGDLDSFDKAGNLNLKFHKIYYGSPGDNVHVLQNISSPFDGVALYGYSGVGMYVYSGGGATLRIQATRTGAEITGVLSASDTITAPAYNTLVHQGYTGTIPPNNIGLLYDHGILWGYKDSTGATVGN